MRKMLSVTALMLSVMLVASSSYADTNTYTARYTTGGVAGVGGQLPVGDPDLGDIGGVRFAAAEGTPLSLLIADPGAQAGVPSAGVHFFAGQSTDGDQLVGETGEPGVTGCARPGQQASLSGSAVPFQAGLAITVFVMTVTGQTGCRGSATHGTVTLTTQI